MEAQIKAALPETCPVSYEELAAIENEFDDIDSQIILKQYQLTASIYAKRRELVSQIPHFWPLVFEQAPTDIDQYITPSDSALLGQLKSLEVSRFEIDPAPVSGTSGTSAAQPQGSPRSVALTFEFAPNEWIEDEILEKKFWYRRAKDGWAGLVSEPVKIKWKKGMDLSEGFTDAAVRLFEAQNRASKSPKGNLQKLSEYKALMKKMENNSNGLQSFFAFFGFRGRHVTAEESEAATTAEMEKRETVKRGEKEPAKEIEDEDMDEDLDVEAEAEIFPAGEELATSIVEDLWPSAIKYWTAAMDEDDVSNSFEMEEELDEGDDEDTMADIKNLVRGKGEDEKAPPKKRRKT